MPTAATLHSLLPPRRADLTLTSEAERWLPEITRRLVGRFQPLGIVLFGSQVRGHATRHSDIDLLVVLATVAFRREAAGAMYASLAGIPAPTDIHVVSAADVVRYHDERGTIVGPVSPKGPCCMTDPDRASAWATVRVWLASHRRAVASDQGIVAQERALDKPQVDRGA